MHAWMCASAAATPQCRDPITRRNRVWVFRGVQTDGAPAAGDALAGLRPPLTPPLSDHIGLALLTGRDKWAATAAAFAVRL